MRRRAPFVRRLRLLSVWFVVSVIGTLTIIVCDAAGHPLPRWQSIALLAHFVVVIVVTLFVEPWLDRRRPPS